MLKWIKKKTKPHVPTYIIHINVRTPSGKKVRLKNPTINYYGDGRNGIEIKMELSKS